ncbi:MAG: DUF368 domain-containing protein [Oscillospiraceae bacterium]|nr:DUF368 domain-containing protein [Oscillospiraceae bacterium]
MQFLFTVIKGICIGIANAVPGVSGGTIAFILKIYSQFLDAMSLKPSKLKKNLPFLIPLVIGILIGLVVASFGLKWLFENHNLPTQFFFIGVIIGSLPMIYKECTSEEKLKPIHIIPFAAAAAFIIFFNTLNAGNGAETINPVIAMIMMAISAAAMIIPGLSGAMVLKIFGGYDAAITAVTEFDNVTLLFYAVGAVIGLLGAAKLISILLKKCRRGMYCVIMGLIVGSIPAIYPGFTLSVDGIIAVVTLVVGLVLPTLMEKIGSKKDMPSEDVQE